jgi:hypothetical protein
MKYSSNNSTVQYPFVHDLNVNISNGHHIDRDMNIRIMLSKKSYTSNVVYILTINNTIAMMPILDLKSTGVFILKTT